MFFSIYKVIYDVNPKVLYADNQSITTIKVVPLNSLGKAAPFRYSSANFEIIEGENLIYIKNLDSKRGIMILQSRSLTGTVIIMIKAQYSLMPTNIEIQIMPNTASLKESIP